MACFGLLIAGVQSDPENVVLPKKPSVSCRGCDTPGRLGSCQQGREIDLETDGLGKLREGFGGAFYNNMRLRLGKEDPGSSGMLRKGCWRDVVLVSSYGLGTSHMLLEEGIW